MEVHIAQRKAMYELTKKSIKKDGLADRRETGLVIQDKPPLILMKLRPNNYPGTAG